MSERLRKFIEDLRNNSVINSFDEAKTKQGIVLPILQCLNWDIFDTDEVSPEHPAGGEVDFSLRINDIDKIFIEVKRVGWRLEQKEERQLCDYSSFKGVELAILTNGLIWQFYLPQLKCSWEKKRFWTINLMEQDLDDIVSKFFNFLEKNKVESGEAFKNAEIIYEDAKRKKIIMEFLPKAWNEIINKPDDLLIELIQNKTEKLCGYKPDIEQVKQFLKEIKVESDIIQIPQIHEGPKLDEVLSSDKKLPRERLRFFIIEVLIKFGGQAPVEQIIDEVGKRYRISQYYLGKDSTGKRWVHAIHSERARMVNVGFIKEKSERGIWQLTSKAKERYEKQDKNY